MKQNLHIRELSNDEIEKVSGAADTSSWQSNLAQVGAAVGIAALGYAFGWYHAGANNNWGYGNTRPR
ncbi:hypothetical protein ACPF4H_003401 [Vibrio cholerae]